jgi:hypothetical protein
MDRSLVEEQWPYWGPSLTAPSAWSGPRRRGGVTAARDGKEAPAATRPAPPSLLDLWERSSRIVAAPFVEKEHSQLTERREPFLCPGPDGADACSRAEARVSVSRLTSGDRHASTNQSYGTSLTAARRMSVFNSGSMAEGLRLAGSLGSASPRPTRGPPNTSMSVSALARGSPPLRARVAVRR